MDGGLKLSSDIYKNVTLGFAGINPFFPFQDFVVQCRTGMQYNIQNNFLKIKIMLTWHADR